jgi:hypothetical protein
MQLRLQKNSLVKAQCNRIRVVWISLGNGF